MHGPAGDPGPLPVRRPRVHGRADEIGNVVDAVDTAARGLVTVTGPGGAGKTTIALEVLHRLAVQFGRRWFVDLTTAVNGADVPARVCHTLGLRPGEVDAEEVLVTELVRAPSLVVLDGCEHLLDEVAALVGELTARCPELTVVATSRRPLAVPGELTVPLGPLPLDEDDGPGPAVRLLVERARDAGAVVRTDDDGHAAALRTICARLDGLPLAIVLAASQLRTVSAPDLADRLAADLTLPAMRGGTRHQRTLTASLDRSVLLLSPGAADLYRRAGALVGASTRTRARPCACPAPTPTS
ncbi:ATP-binding protein [Isoptericola jiangsuensis]|uniref:ATP-binding protein n=1 Tax=Isoptericola jiangsuensis TaxID=548579 RepID=UPI003AAEB69B